MMSYEVVFCRSEFCPVKAKGLPMLWSMILQAKTGYLYSWDPSCSCYLRGQCRSHALNIASGHDISLANEYTYKTAS
jgi:hypothetical protein